MKYFSVPADFKKETIDRYDRLNRAYSGTARIIETYGNITRGFFYGSGRSIEQIPGIDFAGLQEYVEYSKQKHIDFNYTLNSSHMQNEEFSRKGLMKMVNFLDVLYDAGIHSLTIALPSLMEIVAKMKYDFHVKASVICQVTNAEKALAYKKLGIERIVVDESVTRDFRTLKQIREAFGDQLEIIINSICHKNCIYRMFHYNQISTDSLGITNEASCNYYNHRCLLRRYGNTSNLLKLSWVRPEDIKYYTGIGIHYFKIQGRHHVIKGDPVKALEYYFKGSYHGDLLELLDLFDPGSGFRVIIDNKSLDGYLEPFYREENFCKNHCAHCGYCESMAKKCLDTKELVRVQDMTRDFYKEYDLFNRLLASAADENTGSDQTDAAAVDFDFS